RAPDTPTGISRPFSSTRESRLSRCHASATGRGGGPHGEAVVGRPGQVPDGREMLKRIKIQGYKSLVDVEVELQPLSVPFGPHAVGKSNFLDALQLLSRVATSRTLREAFDPPYRGTALESFHFGPGGVKSLLRQESARFSFEADVELSPQVIRSVEKQIAEL